jgi:hypothetical protein
MAGLKQLISFYTLAKDDGRLLPTHISLYLAIFWCYCKSGFQSPFVIFRKDLMRLAHINSIATYHKCLSQLCSYEYISYQPSYNYYKGSLVYLRGI